MHREAFFIHLRKQTLAHRRHAPAAAHSATMPRPPPTLPPELAEEILLRLPPEHPGCLFRASVVCKGWPGLLTGRAFRRRYREFHRTPPLLGFFHNDTTEEEGVFQSNFVRAAGLIRRPPGPGRLRLRPIDARHGRVLFDTDPAADDADPREFLVWDPITHEEWRIPMPKDTDRSSSAVVCAVDGCDHLDCRGHPFFVAFVYVRNGYRVFSARRYSSETAAWSDKTSVEQNLDLDRSCNIVDIPPNVLLGKALYFNCNAYLIRYDLARRELSLIDKPDMHGLDVGQVTVVNDALGFATIKKSSIYLWSREVNVHGIVAWPVPTQSPQVRDAAPSSRVSTTRDIMGFAEGIGAIFTVELKSGRVTKLCNQGNVDIDGVVIPYMSFYIPGDTKDIMPLSPGPSAWKNIGALGHP